jgi:hypothetical protein
VSLPQPHEGIRGVERDEALLSLDPSMIGVRELVRILAMHVYSATLVGYPAPKVQRMNDWMRNPRIGDLVVEESTSYYPVERKRDRFPEQWPFTRMGYLITVREEWEQTDEQWQSELAEQREWNAKHGFDGLDEERMIEPRAWYIQYGPDPADVARWEDCSFIAVPTEIRQFDTLTAAEDGQVTITRQSLVDNLADTGFTLRKDNRS